MCDYDVFISYSRRDTTKVTPIVNFLLENGVKVWIDKDGIESGDAFKSVIVSAIDNASTFLFFSSAASNESEWTVKEVNTAIYKKKRIIPVKLDNSDYSPSILFDLVGLDYIDFTRNNQIEGMLQRLLKSLGKSQSIQPESQSQESIDVTKSQEQKDTIVKEENRRHIFRNIWVYGVFAFHIFVLCITFLFVFQYYKTAIVLALLGIGTYGMWMEVKQKKRSYLVTVSGDVSAAIANCIFCGGWGEINTGFLVLMIFCMIFHWCVLNINVSKRKNQ